MDIKQYFSLRLPNSCKGVFAKIKNIGRAEYVLLPRMVTCIIVVLFLPFLLIFYSTYQRYQILMQEQGRITSLEIKAKKTALVRSRADSFIKQLQVADKNFIKNRLESLFFLQKERKTLESFLKVAVLKESASLLERQKQLDENGLRFEEEKAHQKEHIQEIIYALKRPVEVDTSDLETLLNTIENPFFSHQRHQLILQTFTLKRKNISNNYQLFECDFKLL